ncbi:flagellar assembly protein T N-terminal domain-containing protein [Deferribacter thermophilus]|uniref:flagellar assembly protein T N-terminal domain-containing protein n=1 Tax=Deferribacter thermophilus TaxID=53573 RepID=UPI003C2718CE
MKKIIVFLFLLIPVFVFAMGEQGIFVQSYGEAEIVNNDIQTARLQAIARAKWFALEQAAGVKVKAQSVVQNAVLVDEAIKSETQGVIKGFQILKEGQNQGVYWVQISAFIVPNKAKEALGAISRNTAISVILPLVMPDGRVEESNPLSEKLINELSVQGYEVIDIASGSTFSVSQLDTALRTNNFLMIRNLAYQYLSNVMLVGKITTTLTAREGKNVGYGVSLPYNIVTGRLVYRLITNRNGQRVILASGYISGRGMGPTVEDATYKMIEDMSGKVSNELISTIVNKIKGSAKKIRLVLTNVNDMQQMMQFKNFIQYVSWVLSVNEQGMNTLVVEYPEKALYLAASINSRPNYKVVKFSEYEIDVQILQ